MFLARTSLDARSRPEENFLTELAHLSQNFFEPAVVGNGLLVELGLWFGQRHRQGLSLDFTSPAPGIGRLVHQAALGNPTELKQLLFELFVAVLNPPHCSLR